MMMPNQVSYEKLVVARTSTRVDTIALIRLCVRRREGRVSAISEFRRVPGNRTVVPF